MPECDTRFIFLAAAQNAAWGRAPSASSSRLSGGWPITIREPSNQLRGASLALAGVLKMS
jgi:hypothetical protein